MALHIVILAAGLGTRMYSQTPKVLHPLGGRSLLTRVIDTAQTLHPDAIHVVYGYKGDVVQAAHASYPLSWIHQPQPLGTGHAVLQTLPYLDATADVLVLFGDVPLIQKPTLQALVALQAQAKLSLLVAHLNCPTGLGRVIRNRDKEIQRIVEEKDASEEEKQCKEIFTGIACVKAECLSRWLPQLTSQNAQKELYFTDIIRMCQEEGHAIASIYAEDPLEVQGVNNRLQLQELERIWQQREAKRLLLEGVYIVDSHRFDVRGELTVGKDVFIDINCLFIGKVVLGDHCYIGPNSVLQNVTLGSHTHIYANSVLENSLIGAHCHIGPFARIRPNTILEDHCKIGNFVETKNSTLASGTKANHLSYLGDATIGQGVNIGAGTITCNYDGANKHSTIIEDEVFVGSGTQLVAPITLGHGATIGAGTTIRKNVPPQTLVLSEKTQKTMVDWKRPQKSSPKK